MSIDDKVDTPELDHCIHLKDFMFTQYKVVGRHIDKHKYFQHIPDKTVAIQDFIKKYGWIMREIYCASGCPDYDHCKLGHTFVYGESKDDGTL
jgi:hypothetical protein